MSLKLFGERVIASVERVNRQFMKHRTLWILRTFGAVLAALDLVAFALLVVAGVLADATAMVLLTGMAGLLLGIGLQLLVMAGVLVLWWVNHLRDRDVAAIQQDLSLLRDEVDRVAMIARTQQMREISHTVPAEAPSERNNDGSA